MSKSNVLKKSDIYAITDSTALKKERIADFIAHLIKNNIKIIQLRDKESEFKKILKEAILIKRKVKDKSLLIINDYPEICLLSGADGVHLGQEDLPIKLARNILGKDKIIGVSCHSLKQAEIAQKNGADYIGFGPIFRTPTKKKYKPIGIKQIESLNKKIRIPFFVIGGIDTKQLEELKHLKINRIAVCRALCHTDKVARKIKQLRILLG